MSPGRDQDYFCEGLAEELIDALTHVDGLRVAARSSSFQFRQARRRSARSRAAPRRGLRCVEGSVRKAGDQLRITVQLIDVRHRLSQLVAALRAHARRRVRDPGRDRRERRDDFARRRCSVAARSSAACAGRTPAAEPTSTTCAAASRCIGCAAGSGTQPRHVRSARSSSTPTTRRRGPGWRPCTRCCSSGGARSDEDLHAPTARARSRWSWRRTSPMRTSRAASRCRCGSLRRGADSFRAGGPHQSAPVRRLLLLRARRASRAARSSTRWSCFAKPPTCARKTSRVRRSRRSRCACSAAWTKRARAIAKASRAPSASWR